MLLSFRLKSISSFNIIITKYRRSFYSRFSNFPTLYLCDFLRFMTLLSSSNNFLSDAPQLQTVNQSSYLILLSQNIVVPFIVEFQIFHRLTSWTFSSPFALLSSSNNFLSDTPQLQTVNPSSYLYYNHKISQILLQQSFKFSNTLPLGLSQFHGAFKLVQ